MTDNDVLERANLPSHCLSRDECAGLHGDVVGMDDGPNTKVAPFWRAEPSRPTGIPQVRYKDVSRRDLKALHINFHTLQPLLLTAQTGDRL